MVVMPITRSVGLICLGWSIASCSAAEHANNTYFDERIAPMLDVGCVQQTTGCHLASPEGTAPGNLDLSSYDALVRRTDALHAYGPYAVPLLLLKSGGPITIPVETFGPEGYSGPANQVVNIVTDIRHAAGGGVALDSAAYAKLLQWMEDGYAETGVAPLSLARSQGDCRSGAGSFPGFDSAVAPPSSTFERFINDVQPVLAEHCAGGQCHGSPINNFFLSCGNTEEEKRWNYFVTVQYITDPVATSELLRRPLAMRRGGSYHEGGDVLESTANSAYKRLADWAQAVVTEQPLALTMSQPSAGLRYFANRVQPVLVRKGCMSMGCHSPSMFHDLRFRGGSEGVFSRTATYRNYEAAKLHLAYDSPNANQSRLIAKNLFGSSSVAGAEGVTHRGGSLLEDFSPSTGNLVSARPDFCATVDADQGDLNQIPAYCVLVRWHQIERQQAFERGELRDEPLGLVWVQRPLGAGAVTDFHTFRPGARLMHAEVATDANGSTTLGALNDWTDACGLAGADIRNPAVSWDGTQVAFAARRSSSEPLRLYSIRRDGTNCGPIAGVAAASESQQGMLVHDFDPTWTPDARLVFASTRGGSGGPTRTPAALAPNADLFIASLSSGSPRRLTFLLNQEVSPNVMSDGRLIFTAEKREPDFYQLALRRQNLDGGDYHPLYAQRDSVGFSAATEVAELPNRNLVFVAGAPTAADGAGSLVVVNRSIGPDQADRSPNDRYYQKAVTVLRPASGGAAYRSAAPLPDGRLVYSCATNAADPNAPGLDFDLCVWNPVVGVETRLTTDGATADVEAVALYSRANHGVAPSRIDEANGRVEFRYDDSNAVVEFLDFPMMATLLFANTRTGRALDPRIGGFDVLVASPPPTEAADWAAAGANVVRDAWGPVFVSYRSLGHVPLFDDGSAKVKLPGEAPVLLRVTDEQGRPLQFEPGSPFQGEMVQREQMQFYPGVYSAQSFRRELFDGPCGVCHGSISNRELDIGVNPDVLTSASKTEAKNADAVDLSGR
jgi:hypothetical protein